MHVNGGRLIGAPHMSRKWGEEPCRLRTRDRIVEPQSAELSVIQRSMDMGNMFFFQSRSYDPWYNLALEQALSNRIREGDVLMYLWQNERTVVIGRNQNALRECNAALLESEGGCLARRKTGGGAVYHDLGNLCFTFAASPNSYCLQRQMKVVQDACLALGIQTVLSGRNDLITEEGYKFSGNAFSVTKICRLQHGTLMVDVDRDALERYLTPSKLKLKAKGIASVRSRVCNLKQLDPGITIDRLCSCLKTAFEEEYGPAQVISEEELDQGKIQEYFREFSSWEWRFGKTPGFETQMENLFSWGEAQIFLELKDMKIENCRIYTDSLNTQLASFLEGMLKGLCCSPEGFASKMRELQLQDAEFTEGEASGKEEKTAAVELLAWLQKELQS